MQNSFNNRESSSAIVQEQLLPWGDARAWAALFRADKVRYFVLLDENVAHNHGDKLKTHLPPHVSFILPHGEQTKTLESCKLVWEFLYKHKAERSAIVVVVGGGMAMDMGGFATATWKRGLRCCYIPSTLLGMVDAALGGKVGVNFLGGKNLLGTFANPVAIGWAPQLLSTLPQRELASGYAEMLKHALLADMDYWNALPATFPQNEILGWQLIQRSIAIKRGIVTMDPLEQGHRKVLNLGHTLGHAMESCLLTTPHAYRHGEAIAAGLWLVAELSQQYARLSDVEATAIQQKLTAGGYSLPVGLINKELFWHYLQQDKKNDSGQLNFVLLQQIGQPMLDVPVPAAAVDALMVKHSLYQAV